MNINRNSRVFEIKQACYGGIAALQMACVYLQSTPNAERVLVIATDTARHSEDMHFAEPTQASGAVAFTVSKQAKIFVPDLGAYGFCSYEVMDTCRPDH